MASARAEWREPPSPAVHHWDELAELAQKLARDRAAGDPKAVQAGNLSPVLASTRARTITAIAALFSAAAKRTRPKALQASASEMLADLRGTITRAKAQISKAGVEEGNEDLIPALEAMAWHCTPWPGEQSHLEMLLRHGLGPGNWLLARKDT